MPFDDPRQDIIFTLRMALMHCRVSPKPERHDHIRHIQAEAILQHLERAGYRIVRTDESREVKPSNIGE